MKSESKDIIFSFFAKLARCASTNLFLLALVVGSATRAANADHAPELKAFDQGGKVDVRQQFRQLKKKKSAKQSAKKKGKKTDAPSLSPTEAPTVSPTEAPTASPTEAPTVSPTTSSPTLRGWTRQLAGFDNAALYESVEDPELYEIAKKQVVDTEERQKATIQMCYLPQSKHYGENVSIWDCMRADNFDSPDMYPEYNKNYQPWVVPKMEGVKALAMNPGIWTIENFLSEEELEVFANVIETSKEGGMTGPCANVERNPLTSQPSSESKQCFMISPETICEGPYHFSECSFKPKPDHGTFIKMIQDRAESIVSLQKEIDFELKPYSHIKIQLGMGHTPPQTLHEDIYNVVTFIIYLSDGGGKTIFPGAGVSVTPKRGTAAVFLNIDENRNTLTKSFHALQPVWVIAWWRFFLLTAPKTWFLKQLPSKNAVVRSS